LGTRNENDFKAIHIFEKVKSELTCHFMTDNDDRLTGAIGVFDSISQDDLNHVVGNCIERVRNIIDTGGKYVCLQIFALMQQFPGTGPLSLISFFPGCPKRKSETTEMKSL
jgi:hypothetical protein